MLKVFVATAICAVIIGAARLYHWYKEVHVHDVEDVDKVYDEKDLFN